ncbi:MAG: 1-acyl-sn-glycerol-3-phosphate acyltransferase [Halioglobus sp.]|nr:1-acyl-sn-glycerol-3-phosphate acyltransferase [Halioglobus sp.]|tara:strand:+ start:429 stop:1223 length:795 start_codon:yes stop_codon:yes gene_type:complete
MRESSLHKMAAEVGDDAPLLSSKVLFSGLSFALFGVCGLLLSVSVFPLLYLLPGGAQLRRRRARRLLGSLFPAYVRFMERCGLIRVQALAPERLGGGGQLIIANHPSLLDVVYLIALVGDTNCVVKSSLFYNPFTAGTVRAAGYIRNDSASLLQECAAALAAGDNLVVFPEGTRTDPHKPFRFLRGTANIALAARCDIRPVVIRCCPARLMKHQAWYEMSTQTLAVSLEVRQPIAIAPYLADQGLRGRMSRRLTADLEAYYRAC